MKNEKREKALMAVLAARKTFDLLLEIDADGKILNESASLYLTMKKELLTEKDNEALTNYLRDRKK